MKKLLFVLALALGSLVVNAQEVEYVESEIVFNHDDALSVVVVHYGTSLQDVCVSTINPMTKYIKDQFRGRKVVELYLNPTVGVRAKSVAQTLEDLYYDGITHVIFQPTQVAFGDYYDLITTEAKPFMSQFKEIRIAKPLIYDQSDCDAVAAALKGEISTQSNAVALVINGELESVSAEQQAVLESALKSSGLNNWFVVDSSSESSVEALSAKLAASGAKSICLAPFMFVSGVAAEADVVAAMKQSLESKGFTVELFGKGLGEIEAIKQIYAEHTSFSMTHK